MIKAEAKNQVGVMLCQLPLEIFALATIYAHVNQIFVVLALKKLWEIEATFAEYTVA